MHFKKPKLIYYYYTVISIPRKAKSAVLDILFPPLCLHCRKHLDENKDRSVCDACLNSIYINNTLFCPVCRARLADNKSICHKNSRYLLAAAGDYHDPALQDIIHAFKYQSFEQLAPVLGEFIMKYLKSLELDHSKSYILNSEFSLVIPIPLHPARERKRGFNQAALLAEIIAKNFSLHIDRSLKRIKNNSPQMNLKGSEKRTKNIAGCFAVRHPELINGRNVILVDDVFTSGATIGEAVKVLKSAGAHRIIAIVAAKA